MKKFSLITIVDDIVPLVGLLFLGWNPVIILPLYWVENIAVGYYTFKKLTLPDIGVSGITTKGADGVKRPAGRNELASFFVMHYGIFTLVHGVFAFTAIPIAIAETGNVAADMSPLVWAVPVALVVALVAERFRYIRQTTSPVLRAKLTQGNVVGAAYARIVVLHLSIIFGAWVVLSFGLPQGAAVLLVLLKMTVELFKTNLTPTNIQIGSVLTEKTPPSANGGVGEEDDIL